MPKRAQPVYSLDQEKILRRIGRRIFQDEFKTKKVKKPQVKFGLALGRLSQSSVSDWFVGKFTPGPQYMENLATLAGYESLKEMIGPFAHPASDDDDAPESSKSVIGLPSLRKCVEFHDAGRWKPWTVAMAVSGYFGGADVTPREWEKRLDKLEKDLPKP